MAQNKHSAYEKGGRYVNGGVVEVSQDKLEWWEHQPIASADTDRVYVIEEEYHQRPDKLAAITYGDSRLGWVLLQANSIIDVVDEFVTGRTIIIPTKDRVQNAILGRKIGGIPTTRNGS